MRACRYKPRQLMAISDGCNLSIFNIRVKQNYEMPRDKISLKLKVYDQEKIH
jgi:hypothetical protein